jgi:hypothetical protein
MSAICYCRLYLCRSQEWALHSPSPAGFVCLEFSWPHAPFLFSSIQPYLPVAIAVFFYYYYLEFGWGGAPPPLSGGMCYTLATVTRPPLSKHTGGGAAIPAFSHWLVYLQFEWGVPLCHSPELRVPHPLCYVSFSFFSCLFIIQFVFSLWVGVSLSRRLCWFTMCCLADMVVCISQAVSELASGSAGALQFSLSNVEWGCYAQAGGVEESEFCPLLVVFPARHISSVSPGFYFRKHAFCFLPLVTILENPWNTFKF